MTIRGAFIEMIDVRLSRLDGKTYEHGSVSAIAAAAVADSLKSLREQMIAYREPFPLRACQKCGSENFSGTMRTGQPLECTCMACGQPR